ncbi:exported hypothetical protein [Vibrio coralliirubri]|nr:exported hypothetical protein [Vibrio coralliirubri]
MKKSALLLGCMGAVKASSPSPCTSCYSIRKPSLTTRLSSFPASELWTFAIDFIVIVIVIVIAEASLCYKALGGSLVLNLTNLSAFYVRYPNTLVPCCRE